MDTGDIKSEPSKSPPRCPTVKGFATLQLRINSWPANNAKVVTTCTLTKLSWLSIWHFSIFHQV